MLPKIFIDLRTFDRLRVCGSKLNRIEFYSARSIRSLSRGQTPTRSKLMKLYETLCYSKFIVIFTLVFLIAQTLYFTQFRSVTPVESLVLKLPAVNCMNESHVKTNLLCHKNIQNYIKLLKRQTQRSLNIKFKTSGITIYHNAECRLADCDSTHDANKDRDAVSQPRLKLSSTCAIA